MTTDRQSPPRQVVGLDSLRLLAAVIVALGHGAVFPLSTYLPHLTGLGRAGLGLYNVAFDGVAAVIVFFVISGFCIHYPFKTGAPFSLGAFWVRRLVRVGLPLAVIALIGSVLGAKARAALSVVLWSLYCELIYYLFYPLFRLIISRAGLVKFLASASLLSVALILALGRPDYFWNFHPLVAALAALPAWLWGCRIAEIASLGISPLSRPPWALRGAVFAYAWAASLAVFHLPARLGYPLLLSPFAPLAAYWIWQEMRHAMARPPPAWAERGGRASYSLYLVHNLVLGLIVGSSWSIWLVRLATIILATGAFYGAVEYPSHRLARALSRRVRAIGVRAALTSPQAPRIRQP